MQVKVRKMNRFSLLFCISIYLLASTDAALDAEGIVGGDVSLSNEFTYQISLQEGGSHKCGGSIIGEQHVLTAAHCVTDKSGTYFTTSPKRVVAGAFDLASRAFDAVTADVEKVYIPAEFGLRDNASDIAVLKLKQPLGLRYNSRLSKLELPDAGESYVGARAAITGYGSTWVKVQINPWTGERSTDSGNDSFRKKFAVADVVSNAQCQPYHQEFLAEKRICARVHQRYYDMSEGTCYGDSGGPLVIGNVVIGTVSKILIDCNESSAPAVYTRVSAFLDFIKDAMADRVNSYMHVYEYTKPVFNPGMPPMMPWNPFRLNNYP